MSDLEKLIEKLELNHSLNVDEYEKLIKFRNPKIIDLVREKAVNLRKKIYGKDVFCRGLIEISNYCKNDCLYCGIRRSNKTAERYRLTENDILSCCEEGYKLGFRTFVLQGGEDEYYTDEILVSIIKRIKEKYPDCAITLSLGERSFDSYKSLYDAGADRYLLRHETADREHYGKLHPCNMSYEKRIECLKNLREIGYQTGCGFMVGSPYQTEKNIAADLKFIEEFKPDMCGIGPFIPHHGSPFKDFSAGSVELTSYLISLLRLIYPQMLIPATTALGTLNPQGRELGIISGANVVMPNLSPIMVRQKYELYDKKIFTGEESAQNRDCLGKRMENIGYCLTVSRGDIRK